MMNESISALQLFLFSLVAVFLLSSCSTAFQAHQDMLLTVNEQNDLKATASVNKSETDDESVFFNGQLSYSPIKHVGLSAKHFSYKEVLENTSGNFPTTTRDISGNITELALGAYFTPRFSFMDQETVSEKGFMMDMNFTGDLYFGAGRGKMDFLYNKSAEQLLEFNRMYVQAGFHFNWKIVKISYSFRVVGMDYTKIELIGDVTSEDLATADDLANDSPIFFRSSSLRMQMGPRHAQFYVDMNFNSIPDRLRNFYFYEKIGGMGIIVDINEFYKKKPRIKE